MSVYQISCPGCEAKLQSDKPGMPGTPVKCPRCQALFRIPVPTAVGVAAPTEFAGGWPRPVAPPSQEVAFAAPPTYPVSGVALATAPPVELTAAGLVTAAGPAPESAAPPVPQALPLPQAQPLPPQDNPGREAWLVFGGGAAVLAATIGVVMVCFSGDGARPQEEGPPLAEGPLFLAEPTFKTSAPKPLVELTEEQEKQVAELASKGVDYLKRTQAKEGSWGHSNQWDNYVAFAGLTLLECGVPRDDPVVQKAAAFARSRAAQLNRTYPMSLFILFLSKLNDPQDEKWIQLLSMRLVAGQNAQGGWTYTVPALSEDEATRLSGSMREMGRQAPATIRKTNPELFKRVPAAAQKAGIFFDAGDPKAGFFNAGGDNSNTQFALLGLWAARRHNAPVDRSLELVVRRFRNSQHANGSYSYSGNHFVTRHPSMTCAGLLGLAVDYGLKDKQEGIGPKQDEAIQKALKHLAASIGEAKKDHKGKAPMTDMYFLWSVERVAVLYQLPTIEDKEWYQWGLWMLADNQKADGSWRSSVHVGQGDELTDTCFALLFLQRANLAQDLTDKLTEALLGAPPVIAAPAKKD